MCDIDEEHPAIQPDATGRRAAEEDEWHLHERQVRLNLVTDLSTMFLSYFSPKYIANLKNVIEKRQLEEISENGEEVKEGASELPPLFKVEWKTLFCLIHNTTNYKST